jgi:hypothetical protein
MAASGAANDSAPRRGAGAMLIDPRLMRAAHAWAGALFAPAILFFAVTGGLQVYDLHKAHGDYRPPAALQALAALHKDQALHAPAPRPPAAGGEHRRRPPGDADDPAPPPLGQQLLKAYAALGAVGLTLTTLAGLWMSLRYRRDRLVMLALLAVGAAAPLALLLV